MTQETKLSAGAVRAAKCIFADRPLIDYLNENEIIENISKAIEYHTHVAEMLAFIEKVAEMDLANFVPDIQAEAQKLIKKARE